MSKPLGPGGVALLVVLAAALPVRCALLSDLAAIPNPFSPNGDGTYDETTLSYTLSDSAWTVIAVEDSSGAVVRELWSGYQAADRYSYVWDGRGTGGDVAPDGTYRFAATADAERRTLSLVLDTEAPGITQLSLTPSRFTPDGDGVSDSLLIGFVIVGADAGDLVTASVVDPDDDVVASLLQTTGVDTVSLVWDGGSGGSVAADTTYGLVVEALDSAGNASIEESMIDLDTDPPSIGSAAPDTSGVVAVNAASLELSGWVYDRAGVDSLQYSTDLSTWTNVPLTAHPTVSGASTWTFDLACEDCELDVTDETRSVTLRSFDGTLTADSRGHVNTDTSTPPWFEFDVVYDVAAPVHTMSEVLDDDAVYEPGETVTIETVWDKGGYDIDAFFHQLDSEFDEEDVTVSDFGNGTYEVRYTISASSTLVPVGPERVRIAASDYFHAVADSSVSVSVVQGSSSTTGLSVDANSFDPGEGETVTINPGGATGSAEIDIYTMTGALVVSLETEAGTPVTWDGTNSEGETVASGVYFLLIRVDGDESVRKIAVVK